MGQKSRRRISKTDTRSEATAYRGAAILIALPFLGIGGTFALSGFGFLPPPSGANARSTREGVRASSRKECPSRSNAATE